MKQVVVLVVCGVYSSVVAQLGGVGLPQGPTNFRLDQKPAPPPTQQFKPLSPFFPPLMPLGPPGPPTPNDGLFMDLPQTGGAGGYGAGPYAGPPVMRSYQYCPPGPTTADHCKDQKLQEALYFPDGTPRYNWVPPRNPWDTSLPDTVKETAKNILMMKVNSRPNRTPTPKEWELMSLLGDPKEQGPAHSNPFAMAG